MSAYSTTTVSDKTVLDSFASESEMTITSSKTQVCEFVTKNKDFTTSYNTDECYNITPNFIADNSDFAIFKYDGDVYSIGGCFGVYGITSMALADIDIDGQYELYYTFSCGSGIHRSHQAM